MAESPALRRGSHAEDASQSQRPGVPMESLHRDHNRTVLAKQTSNVRVFKRVGLEKLTPVFGTAQPPKGLSGWIKTKAYARPETDVRHWALLLFSDRVDAMEGKLSDAFTRKPFLGVWILVGAVGWFLMRDEKKA